MTIDFGSSDDFVHAASSRGSSSSFGSSSSSNSDINSFMAMAGAGSGVGSGPAIPDPTNTKYHAMMVGAAAIGVIGFGMSIGGIYSLAIVPILYSAPVLILSGWMIKLIIANLMLVWVRSMGKAIAQRIQLIHRFAVGGIVAYSIGSALVISGLILFYNLTSLSSFRTAVTLVRLGYGITLTYSLLLTGLSLWQYVETQNDGVPGLGFKRRQLLVVAAHCLLIFISDLCYVLLAATAGHVFSIFVLGVGVYTRKALTGFDEEPDLTSCMPAIMPNAAYNQQTVNMANNPNMVFIQPVHMGQPNTYQHHVGTEEANTSTPATYPNA
ncbi:hypothetical protein BDF19DRAFT_435470 [Syncephalis fuscata]|nr:hypothetical protein BDF19DRAFT_435470 [Syncephalis fuscata]